MSELIDEQKAILKVLHACRLLGYYRNAARTSRNLYVLVSISHRDMKFDTTQEGLHTLFKPYQAALLEHIWKLNNPSRNGITSGQAHEYLQDHPDKKSRASVIFFLNDMVDEGVLTYEEKSGKGGYHRVYYPNMDRDQFAKYVTKTITDKLHEVFQH